MSLEILYPETANVILYPVRAIFFHYTTDYDVDGNSIGNDENDAELLYSLIEEPQQKVFEIRKPNKIELQSISGLEYYNHKIEEVQGVHPWYSQVSAYYYDYFGRILQDAMKKYEYNLTDHIYIQLLNRLVKGDKSYTLRQIKNDVDVEFYNWMLYLF